MTARSYLFVPGDQPAKMAKAAAGNADAIILDLEDSVAEHRKDEALRLTCDFLRKQAEGDARPSSRFWVRVNAGLPDRAMREVCALPLAAIAGLFVPKLSSIAALQPLAFGLDALETRDGVAPGSVGLVGIVTETAASFASGAELSRGHPRLRGYCWGVEDLSADIGRPPLEGRSDASERLAAHAQMFCLMAAAAAGIDAIDAIEPDFRNEKTLADAARRAADLGFAAKMAIHPAQLEAIHRAFTPAPEALDWARRVLEIADGPTPSSAFQLDGRMIDQPHIRIARALVEKAKSNAE